MIYQRADGKIITTAAGKLYTGACPPPPNCCADDTGWNGNPPWGPGPVPPWFDPRKPDDIPTAANCPEGACQAQEESGGLCSQLAIGGPGCAFCCCPTRDCRTVIDQTTGHVVDTADCIVDLDLRWRIRYYSRTTTAAGSFGTEYSIDSDARYHQNPLANQPNEPCCKFSGTQTLVERLYDTRIGFDQTNTVTSPAGDGFGATRCPVIYRSVSGLPPWNCIGSQPPPPDPAGCGGGCDIDILTAYRDCRQATFRRYQKTNFVDQYGPGFTESEQVYFAVCRPYNGSTGCPLTFRLNTPECASAGGGAGAGAGGNLP